MTTLKYVFPQGFKWGTATSSYQVEGSNLNSTWAPFEEKSGTILNGDRSGAACDWWAGSRWKEDFNRASANSQNAHRLSLEWSRIQPKPDVWNEEALDGYRQMIRGAISNGLKPLVTLHHFSDPIWFGEIGGWENPDAPQIFNRFVEKTVSALKPLVSDWIPINEPNVYVFNGYLIGNFPPQKKLALRSALKVLVNMLRGHASAYETIHRIQPEANVGTSVNVHGFFPARNNLRDRFLSRQFDHVFNGSFLDVIHNGSLSLVGYRINEKKVKNTQDFVGMNYYTASQIQTSTKWTEIMTFPEGTMLSDTGFIGHEPEYFEKMLLWAKKFKKPIIITENGTENRDDVFRRTYLAEHLISMWRAISKGASVKGYYHWTLVDSFEWERGWIHPFGLWELDRETQKRTRRDSADFYKQVISKNALESEDILHFAPDVFKRSIGE